MSSSILSRIPSLNALKTFDAAARWLSFKLAAEELHITPAAVSHQIKGLEEALGVLLFERKTRAIALTTHGRTLACVVADTLSCLSHTVAEITAAQQVINVSTTPAFAAMWLVPRLGEFMADHPSLDVAVKTTQQLVDVDHDQTVDLAISYGRVDARLPGQLHLCAERMGVYGAPELIQRDPTLTDAVLIETRWTNTELPPIAWRTLLPNEDRLTVRRFDQEHHAIQAALAGQGLVLVSELLVEKALQERWLLPYSSEVIALPESPLGYYLRVPKRSSHRVPVQQLVRWLQIQCQAASE